MITPPKPKNAHAQALGKLGGRKPGFAGKPLDPAKAKAMVAVRWAKYRAINRLEYLREEIRLERISYGEINELQSLVKYIHPGDVELLQWAGVDENHTKAILCKDGAYE